MERFALEKMDSRDWDNRYESLENVWSLSPNQFVVEYLENLPVGSMIDLAGGEGRNALWFASRGWNVENVEFSKVALGKFAQRSWDEDLEIFCKSTHADVTADPQYALREVDLGVIIYLQIEAEGLSKAISSLVSNLKSGGTFFGVWHARENLTDGFAGPQDPNVLPTQEELRQACTQAGLSSISIELRSRFVQTVDALREAIDVVVIASRAPSLV